MKLPRRLIIGGLIYLSTVTVLSVMAAGLLALEQLQEKAAIIRAEREQLQEKVTRQEALLASTSASLTEYVSQDQYKINQQLQADIKATNTTFKAAATTYEDLVELKMKNVKTVKLDEQFASILTLLSNLQWTSASAALTTLSKEIKTEEDKISTAYKIPENVPVSNQAPGSGYSRQQVQTTIGTYMVSIVSADLRTTRVVVDTASGSDCGNDCPVLPLGDFVARSGAFAGINGPYFCPATYPACAEKKNTFDTLIMNKNKVYFNSDNNIYSIVPLVIFSDNGARFMGKSAEWGRDTGVDSVIAAQPMLVSGGNVVFGGDGDPKKGSKGARGFIGATGSTVYIGHVHNATVAESAQVLAALGVQNALNLDGGGSVALWVNGGYKVGPGRALPLGILFVRK